jgi:putative ABC transport system permease protein
MLRNYLKIAIRNIWKRKEYSFINVFGLSLGVAATILLFLYGQYELSWDEFNKKSENIYQVYKERVTPSGTQDTFDTWVPLRSELLSTYPVIEKAVRVYNTSIWVEGNEKKFQETVTYTDDSLFDMFSFNLQKGDLSNPFPDLHSAIISKDIAQKYFGDTDPIGKVLRLNFDQNYVVSGVLEDIPQNSSVQMDIAVLGESSSDYEDFKDNWNNSFLNTYILLQPGASSDELEAQFPDFITKIWDEETASRTNFKLMPLTELNDNFANSDQYAYIHIAIALVIIVIAGINFMNMSTARSIERAKEVGMRKALGARRFQVIRQFLGEAILLSVVAVLFGILMAELALPYFNSLYNVGLSFDVLGNLSNIGLLLGFTLLIGLLAGGYPAFYLSKFQSVETLRGKIQSRAGGAGIRHGLLVAQFAITIVLIVGTLVVRDQIQYMKNANLGFEKENTLVINVAQDDFDNPEQAQTRLQTFKDQLSQMSEVVSVASSQNVPGQWSSSFTFVIPEGHENQDPMRVRFSFMDHNFFETWGIELLEGRSFREGSEVDMRGKIIVNKSALEEFGCIEGVGKQIGLGSSGSTKIEVIGVVEDYNFQSLQNPVAPILHVYRPPENGIHNFITVKLQTSDLSAAMASLREQWNIMDPSREMNYFFADQNFNEQYQRQEQLATIGGSFSILAIIVACLGLLGLVSLMIRQRIKEIGVRKVLGASVGRILVLLSGDYLKLVAVGFVIAAPVAWYLMQQWLQDYAYHIELGFGVFAMAGVIALTIAVGVVCLQAYRAARVNPVESLRDE